MADSKQSLAGTTVPSFQIGIGGPTFFQGAGTPATSLGVNGDIYLQLVTAQVYQKRAGTWKPLSIGSHTFHGSVANVGSNATNLITIEGSTASYVMFKPGNVVGLSIATEDPRTQGRIRLRVVKNSVEQTAESAFINATNPQFSFIVFTAPISYVAGDRITAQTTTLNSFQPSNTGALVSIFCEDS